MNDSFRWSKMQMMQKALFVLLLVLSACTGEEKATIPDEPETPEAKITLAKELIRIHYWMLLVERLRYILRLRPTGRLQ